MSKDIELNLSGVEMPKQNSNSEFSPTIPLGVDNFTIAGTVVGESPAKKTPYIEVNFKNGESIPFNERFYLTPKALQRVKELLINCGVSEDESNKANLNQDDINKMLSGRSIRLLIGGEEWLNQEGKVRIRRKLPFRNFSESVLIPMTETKLKFSREFHVKGVDNAPASNEPTKDSESTDLPF